MKQQYATIGLIVFGATLGIASADPAAAQNVRWQDLVGVIQPLNQVGTHPDTSSPPNNVCGSDCIVGGGQPWVTERGQAKINLANGQLEFTVGGLVLAGGNTIGTPGAVTQVKGTLICIPNPNTPTSTNTIIDTTAVALSPTGDAHFSGNVGSIPNACGATNIAFLVRIAAGGGINRWIAAGAVRSSNGN
jgi:hypothetical protein